MKRGTSFLRRFIPLAVAGILVVILAACTGRGGGYLPPNEPHPGFTGPASFGFTFSCEHKGGVNPPTGQLRIQLAYTEHGTYLPVGAPFSIHGIVDSIAPIEESMFCIGDEPPPLSEFGNQLIFLGSYRPTTSAPAGLQACPTRQTRTTPLCRFEVIVRDNDQDFAPSPGDYFSIKLSTITDPLVTIFPVDPLVVPYARAGYLAGGNLTVR